MKTTTNTVSEATTKILALAEKHANNGATMQSSAIVCLDDARRFASEGREAYAQSWAIRSLSYTVGIFHADHRAAEAMADAVRS